MALNDCYGDSGLDIGAPLTKSASGALAVDARVQHRETGLLGKVQYANGHFRGRNVAVTWETGDIGLYDADELMLVS